MGLFGLSFRNTDSSAPPPNEAVTAAGGDLKIVTTNASPPASPSTSDSVVILRATELGNSPNNFLCQYSMTDGSVTSSTGLGGFTGGLVHKHNLHETITTGGIFNRVHTPVWRITGIDYKSRANADGSGESNPQLYNFEDFMPLGGIGTELQNKNFT